MKSGKRRKKYQFSTLFDGDALSVNQRVLISVHADCYTCDCDPCDCNEGECNCNCNG